MLIKLNSFIGTRFRRSQLGIGLLELMLSLAIISVLLVMATRYYKSARQGQQVNDAISLIQAVVAGSANWAIGHPNYQGINIQQLITEGLLPKGSDSDPWFGQTSVSASSNPNEIIITLNGLPKSGCLSLADKVNNQTAHPRSDSSSMCGSGDPTTFTAVF